jgi:hypothetical protein
MRACLVFFFTGNMASLAFFKDFLACDGITSMGSSAETKNRRQNKGYTLHLNILNSHLPE